jgi:hypothetical protein
MKRPLLRFTEIIRETISGDDTAPVLVQPEAVLVVRRRAQQPYQGHVTGSVLHLEHGIEVKVAEDIDQVRAKLCPPSPRFVL